MDASTTLLALGWGRGSHAPGTPQTPPASSPVQQERQRSPGRVSQGGAADWDTVVAEQNARLGLQPGANPGGPQRSAAPAVSAPQQAGAVDWADIAAEANAKLPPNAVIPGRQGGRS